ncbi:MAG: hypothetical protein ACP5G4_03685, partial [bacterium]
AQTVEWSHSYNNDIEPMGWDIGYNVFETEDNGFLVVGITEWWEISPWVLHDPFMLIKTDEYGNESEKNFYCRSIRMAIAREYVEDTIVVSAADRFFYTNRDGDSLDCVLIPIGSNESSFTYEIMNDGSFLLVRGLLPDSGSALVFQKYSRSGELIWRREQFLFGEDYDDEVLPHLVKRKSDGNYLVAGSTLWEFGYWLLEVDSLGDILWSINPEMSISSIYEKSPGNFLCLGAKPTQISILNVLDGGDIRWTRSWMFDSSDVSWTGAFSLIPTYDNNFAFCGYTGHIYGTEHLSDGYIMKIDSLANVIWQQRVDIYGRSDKFYSVIQASDSSFVCTGYTSLCTDPDSVECESLEVCLVKISNDGDIIWENSITVPKQISLSAYPNPFNSAVTISFKCGSESAKRLSTIEIFDLNGRMVDDISVGEGLVPCRTSGDHKGLPYEYIWTPSESLGSGVYLIRATVDPSTQTGCKQGSGTETITKRVVYLK